MWPPNLTEQQRKEFGMTEKLPTSLKDAIQEVKKDEKFWRGALGDTMYEAWLHIKEYEADTEGKKDEWERKRVLVDVF